ARARDRAQVELELAIEAFAFDVVDVERVTAAGLGDKGEVPAIGRERGGRAAVAKRLEVRVAARPNEASLDFPVFASTSQRSTWNPSRWEKTASLEPSGEMAGAR